MVSLAYGFVIAGLFGNLLLIVVFAGVNFAGELCIVFMTQRTKSSIELMGKILGLKNFIEKAELNRINILVEENPNYFYNILPYAYVMGLTCLLYTSRDIILGSIRSTDVCARINEEQFILLVNCSCKDDTYIIIQRISNLFYKTYSSSKYRLNYGVEDIKI